MLPITMYGIQGVDIRSKPPADVLDLFRVSDAIAKRSLRGPMTYRFRPGLGALPTPPTVAEQYEGGKHRLTWAVAILAAAGTVYLIKRYGLR